MRTAAARRDIVARSISQNVRIHCAGASGLPPEWIE
jgi:hypothetical protein